MKKLLGCLGKFLGGCLLFVIIIALLIVLLFGAIFRGKLFGVDYTLNADGESYSLSDYGAWNFKKSFSIPTTYKGKPVTKISSLAFEHSGLTEINISSSITMIEDGAFNYSYNLKSFMVDQNNPNYKSIDGNLYTKDGTVLVQYAIGKTAAKFEIPDGVTEIGEGAFNSCEHLISISIPDSVTAIGAHAFTDCYNLIGLLLPTSVTEISYFSFDWTTIYYKGSAQEWGAIDISDSEFFPSNFELIFYSETAPTEEGDYWHYDENGNIAVWE